MHTSTPWKLDDRNGCLAIYPASEEHRCLSGAQDWAIHFKMGYQEEINGMQVWTVDPADVDTARFIVTACNNFDAMLAALKDELADISELGRLTYDAVRYARLAAVIAAASPQPEGKE
jgi:hypothetical protein